MSYPAISLRMKWTMPDPSSSTDIELATDQINAMVDQETGHYSCGDYLLRDQYAANDEHALDALARKKMIDWKFRVVDHYGISRDTVAASTSILDRFVDHCRCDKMAFKLAAMTSLYMASKVHDCMQLPMAKLVELSRGEFLATDVIEMEGAILTALAWRVNPVTVEDFIHSFVTHLLPVSNSLVASAINDRAIFFAELCLFDYSYVTKSRSAIAVAAVLNALEGIGDDLTCQDEELAFLESLQVNTCLDVSSDDLEYLREDLWYIYSMSAQYQDDGAQTTYPSEPSAELEKQHGGVPGEDVVHIAHSPVSVLNRKST